MTYRLLETQAWQRSMEALSSNARVALPYALDRIQADLHELHFRRLRADGAYVDYGAQGLLIAYRVLDDHRIRLLDVLDVKEAHRW